MIENLKICVIGAGNMATAIVRGMASAVNPRHITVSDLDNEKLEKIAEIGVNTAKDNKEAAKMADVVIIAVKPNIYPAVLKELSDFSDKLYITIAPGLSIKFVSEFFGGGARVIRTMPNMPAQINSGMTVFCHNSDVSENDVEIAEEILSCFGYAMELDEKLLDAAVAVNGSGPAYVFMMIEAMADAAVKLGIPRDKAYVLAAHTVAGSAEMVLETKKHPAELKDMVCSPAGTTIDAVEALEQHGFRAALMDAMTKCAEKSKKLGK